MPTTDRIMSTPIFRPRPLPSLLALAIGIALFILAIARGDKDSLTAGFLFLLRQTRELRVVRVILRKEVLLPVKQRRIFALGEVSKAHVQDRPPANACRNAASEKATARPICLAYVAASIASRVSGGNRAGHRIG